MFAGEVPALGGTAALRLLNVFGVVDVAVLALRKDAVGLDRLRTPTRLTASQPDERMGGSGPVNQAARSPGHWPIQWSPET